MEKGGQTNIMFALFAVGFMRKDGGPSGARTPNLVIKSHKVF